MKRLILLLLTLSTLTYGQNKIKYFVLTNGAGSGTTTKTYLPKQSVTTLSSPVTITSAGVGSSVTSGEISGNKHVIVSTPFTNTLRTNGLEGTRAAPFIFQGASGYTTVGGPTLPNGSNVFGQTSTPISTWIRAERLHLRGTLAGGVTSMTGVKWQGRAEKSNLAMYDIAIDSMSSPYVQFNGDGDAGRYGRMEFRTIVGLGDGVNGSEIFYFGDTSGDAAGLTDSLLISDSWAGNSQWDTWQANKISLINSTRATMINAGIEGTSGQQALLQLQDMGDGSVFENFLGWGAPRIAQIGARNLTLRYGVLKGESALFWQDLETQIGITTPLSTAGGTNYIDGLEIYSDGGLTYGIDVNENKANFIFINSIKGTNVTNLIDDNRSDQSTYKIYEINTTTQATPPTPAFVNSTDVKHEYFGCVTNDYYYDKGLGYRVPPVDRNYPSITNFTSTAQVGEDIVITGSNFTGTTSVTIGDDETEAASFTVDSDTQITAEVASGTVDGIVVVYNAQGAGARLGFELEASFNPFTDITWVAAFDPTTFSAGTWPNSGSGADAVQGSAAALPTLTGSLSTRSGSGLVFTSSPQTGLQYGTGTVTEPFETWIEIITPASFTGTQRIYANGSATRCTINASGQILVAGTSDVSTGLTLSTNTRYVLRIVNNGASSSITANNGTPLTFTITAQNGSSTPKIGHAYSAGSGHVNMTIGDFFQKSTVLSGGEITSMWEWFGF